jgi:hypothetical protein
MKNKFEQVLNCPLCLSASSDGQIMYYINSLTIPIAIIKCKKCGLHFKEKFPTIDFFSSIYGDSYTHYNNENIELQIEDLNHRASRIGRSNGKLLDYGCGNGSFVMAALNKGWDAFGCDPFLPEVLANVELQKRCIKEDFSLISKKNEYDCITMWATAEHLVNTKTTFENLCSSLKLNGILIFNSPFGNSKISKQNGENWNMANLVEHLQFHTFESVSYLARTNKMKVIDIRICGIPFPLGTVAKVSGNKMIDDSSINNKRFDIFSFLLNDVIMKNKLKTKDMLSFFIDKFQLGDHIEVKLLKIE